MARLTITEAARVTGVSRITLHRYIKAGKLSRNADKTIDTAELLRIGLPLQHGNVIEDVAVQPEVTPETTTHLERIIETLEHERDLLAHQLVEAQERERTAREREARLLQMLEQAQRQQQYLLETSQSSRRRGVLSRLRAWVQGELSPQREK